MAKPASESRDGGAGRAVLGALALVLAAVAVRLAPELRADAWQDEAATLVLFASRGFWYPFSDYSLPNNHMLFSALLAAWWERGDPVWLARLLPALLALLAAALAGICGRRLVGVQGAALGLAMFVASDVTQAYALALRGQALSWVLVVTQLASVRPFVCRGRLVAGAAFAFASVASAAVLPTNVLFGGVCVAFALLSTAPRADRRAKFGRAALALLAVVGGLAVYVPHVSQVVAHAARGWAGWQPWPLLGHWVLATLGDYLPLLPLTALGAAAACRTAEPAGRRALGLFACMGILPALAVACAPVALFPRLLVPGLPLWYLALGGLTALGIQQLPGTVRLRAPGWTAVLVLAVAASALATPACAGFGSRAPGTHDLCQQFHRRDYRPTVLLVETLALFGPRRPPILVDDEGAAALGFAQWNAPPARPLPLIAARDWRARLGPAARPSFAIADSAARVEGLLSGLDAGRPTALTLVIDSGYFDLYFLRWD